MQKLIMKISCLLMCFLLVACSGTNSNEESPDVTPSNMLGLPKKQFKKLLITQQLNLQN